MIVYTRDEVSDIQEVEGRLVDVFVNEQIRRCVTFLYQDRRDSVSGEVKRVAVGTAFLISKSLDDDDLDVDNHLCYPTNYFNYLVTAGHVIADIAPATIYVRLNKEGNALYPNWLSEPVTDIPTHKDQWLECPGRLKTDVRVYRLKIPSGRFTLRALPFATLTTKRFTARENIGSGDEVFYVGLFTPHPGETKRVEPVIRFREHFIDETIRAD